MALSLCCARPQKEIHEQPDSILQTMSGRVNLSGSHKVGRLGLGALG